MIPEIQNITVSNAGLSLAQMLKNHKKVRPLLARGQARALVSKKPPAAKAKPAKATKGRINAILRAPEAKGRRALAEHLALETDLTAATSIAVLKASPETSSGRLAAAMAQAIQPNLGPGGPGGGSSDEATAAAKRLAGYVNRRPAKLRVPAVATPRATGGEEAEIERAARRIAGSL